MRAADRPLRQFVDVSSLRHPRPNAPMFTPDEIFDSEPAELKRKIGQVLNRTIGDSMRLVISLVNHDGLIWRRTSCRASIRQSDGLKVGHCSLAFVKAEGGVPHLSLNTFITGADIPDHIWTDVVTAVERTAAKFGITESVVRVSSESRIPLLNGAGYELLPPDGPGFLERHLDNVLAMDRRFEHMGREQLDLFSSQGWPSLSQTEADLSVPEFHPPGPRRELWGLVVHKKLASN